MVFKENAHIFFLRWLFIYLFIHLFIFILKITGFMIQQVKVFKHVFLYITLWRMINKIFKTSNIVLLIFYKNLACLYRTGVLVNTAILGIHSLAHFFQVYLFNKTQTNKEPNKFDISWVVSMWWGILCTSWHFMLTAIVP